MKKLFFILFALVTFAAFSADTTKTVVQANDTSIEAVVDSATLTTGEVPPEVQKAAYEEAWNSVLQVIYNIDWLFLVIFIIIIGTLEMYIRATNKATWLNWLNKIPIAFWVLIIAIILSVFYCWVFDQTSKEQIFWMVITVFISMFVYKFGIDKLLKYIGQKLFGLVYPVLTAKPAATPTTDANNTNQPG